jgi:methylenetetrahydrofolate dehydrogenase (NADP+)/methenyltetrahydrofolate cyclohydrolase
MQNQAKLVNGKDIAEKMFIELTEKARAAAPKKLCFVSFGGDAASRNFVQVKSRLAQRLGVETDIIEQKVATTDEAILFLSSLEVKNYDGIVIQLPLPGELNTNTILDSLPKNFDIDMLGQEAKEAYKTATTDRVPPVAQAVREILGRNNVTLEDKKIVILGNGRLVGEPVSAFFEHLGLSYTTLDKTTSFETQQEHLLSADIIISGIGVPHYLTSNMIKDGVILIDAGTSEQEGKLAGDIDPACISKASLITPVPGGVGPITVTSLFYNLFRE